MNNRTINILSPSDIPFGKLSNNYVLLMEIDDKKWKSVSNYVYSNTMPSSIYSITLQNIKPYEASKEFNTLIDKMIEETIFTSIQNGVAELIDRNEKFREALFATGNAPIKYDSENRMIGAKSGGQNIAGKVLEQLRNQYIVKQQEEGIHQSERNFFEKIQTNLTAYTILSNMIRNGQSSLKEFLGKEPAVIIQESDIKLKPNFTIELAYSMHKSNTEPMPVIMASLLNFDVAIHFLRKEHLENASNMKAQIIKRAVFDEYLREMLRRVYPNFTKNEINTALATIFQVTEATEIEKMEDRMMNILNSSDYGSVGFSGHLMELLYKKIEETKFADVSPREIEEAKKYVLPKIDGMQKPHIATHYTDQRKPPFVIVPSSTEPLCLEHENSAVNIDGLIYPSVMHYAYASLLSLLSSVKNMVNAHKLLLINREGSIHDLSNYVTENNAKKIFFDELTKSITNDIRKYAKIALDKKFQNKSMQILLLTTNNAKLVWSDANDVILGMTKGRGENFAGKYIMKLRDEIKLKQPAEKEVKISELFELIETDDFFNNWIKMRIDELLMNTFILASCCKTKITEKFISIVINALYDRCENISEEMKKMSILNVPEHFEKLVRSFNIRRKNEDNETVYENPMKKVHSDVVETVWRYILILLKIMFMESESNDAMGMRQIIAQSEINLSSKQKCYGNIKNNLHRCIFSAIVNVLAKIKQIKQSVSSPFAIAKNTVDLAVNIILNKNIERASVIQTKKKENPSIFEMKGLPVAGYDSDEEEEEQGELEFVDSDVDSQQSADTLSEDESEISDKENEEGIMEEEEQVEDEDQEEQEEDEEKIDPIVVDYHILNELKIIDEQVVNQEEASKLIHAAIDEVVKYKMPFNIKLNRINFFATLLQ